MTYQKLTPEQWAQIPPEYVWFAVDFDGSERAYQNEPIMSDIGLYWKPQMPNGEFTVNVVNTNKCPQWRDSKQKRPTINEQPKNTPTPAVTHIRLSMADFERIAADFGLNVRHCETYCDAAMYNPAGQIAIVFVADVPVNVTVNDAVGDVSVTVHDQILLSKCKCGNNAQTEHSCPYAEDILGVSEICSCCKECTYQCSQDI